MTIKRSVFHYCFFVLAALLGAVCISTPAEAQTSLTWAEVKSKFEAVNPALKADALGVDELRAEEITAYLRPNPQFNFAVDGTQFPHKALYQPLTSDQEQGTFSYLTNVSTSGNSAGTARWKQRASASRCMKTWTGI